MSRLIVIAEIDDETGKLVTSHGYNEDTFEHVVLPVDHPSLLGAYFDGDIGEWVIPDRD